MNRKLLKLIKNPKQYFIDSKLFYYLGLTKTKNKGLTKIKRQPELVVSLTTFPAREEFAAQTIETILSQSLLPDRIVIWLSEDECGGKIIPHKLSQFEKKGVEFRFTKYCLRSYQKLIFTLLEFPDSIIITVDDDVIYQEDMIEKLFLNYILHPDVISCHRAHLIKIDKDGNVLPYKEWKMRISDHNPSFLHLATGVGGVLYPPYCLFPDIVDIEKIKNLAPTCDDLWFWGMEVLNGYKVQVVNGNNSKLKYASGSQDLGKGGENQLHNNNVEQGWNDIQLKNILIEYPEILDIAQGKSRKAYFDIISGKPHQTKNTIHVAFICDENYLVPTVVSITSLKINRNIKNKHNINILTNNISEDKKRFIKQIEEENFSIRFIDFSTKDFEKLHEGPKAKNLSASIAALEKFKLADILNIDKVIYLDSDILVRKDLAELYDIDISNSYAGVCFDTGLMYSQRIQKINARSYFNSGVMLLNLKLLRKDRIGDKLIKEKAAYQDKSLMDQNIFNIVFKGHVKFLSIKYNLLYVNLMRARDKYSITQLNQLFKSNYRDLTSIRKESVIIHFSSKDKPWKNSNVPLSKEWASYYEQSIYGARGKDLKETILR